MCLVFGEVYAGVVRACRSRHTLGGVGEHPPSPPPPQANPPSPASVPGTILFKTENIQPQSLPWGGEGKEVEWEEVDPGRKKREIRPRETARRGSGTRHFCHLAVAGARARPRPGPARRGESPAAAAPPHALPRRPRARGRPGQVAAVPGSGRPGAAAASERGGGGGQRRLVLPLGPVRAGREGRAVRGPAGSVRIYSPRFLRCVSALFSASADGAQGRRAGGEGEPGSPLAPSLPATPGQPAPALARGRRERRRAPGGGGGAAPACAERGKAGGRREGHKGRRRAPGSPGRPWRRGGSRPLMNINRTCGLARTGWARRPARVSAAARRRASEAGPGGARRVSPLALGLSPGCPRSFWKVHIWAALPGRSRSPTRLWKGRRK